MNIEHKIIADKIHLLIFPTQKDITLTFLRFQEYYESPKFRGKIFSLDEFKEWYTKTSPNGISSGEFTYYSDWNGFNIPSYILQSFYDGLFNPLSNQEKQLLDIFKNETDRFYIIGIHKETNKFNQLLKHEIAHGLFYINDNYRNEIIQTIQKYDVKNIKQELSSKAGYHDDVLEDEVHAYSIDSASNLKTFIPEILLFELRQIYDKYIEQDIKS